jgi:putative protease
MTNGERIGEVTHYFGKINVAVLRLTSDLKIGDTVHFLGRNTDFPQEIASMQIEHEAVAEAKAGEEVAVKVTQRVRRGDSIFRLEESE